MPDKNSNKNANTASTIIFALGSVLFILSAILPFLLHIQLPVLIQPWTTSGVTYQLLFPNWITVFSVLIMALAIGVYYLLRKKNK